MKVERVDDVNFRLIWCRLTRVDLEEPGLTWWNPGWPGGRTVNKFVVLFLSEMSKQMVNMSSMSMWLVRSEVAVCLAHRCPSVNVCRVLSMSSSGTTSRTTLCFSCWMTSLTTTPWRQRPNGDNFFRSLIIFVVLMSRHEWWQRPYTVCLKKTGLLQLIWHNFINSQLLLTIFGTERPCSIILWLR